MGSPFLIPDGETSYSDVLAPHAMSEPEALVKSIALSSSWTSVMTSAMPLSGPEQADRTSPMTHGRKAIEVAGGKPSTPLMIGGMVEGVRVCLSDLQSNPVVSFLGNHGEWHLHNLPE